MIGLDRLIALQGREMVSDELIGTVLDEAGRLCADVLAPLNEIGDREGSRLENGVVRTPAGFREAYRHLCGGRLRNGLPLSPDHGGQGLPWPLHAAVMEMVQSANLSFGLNPLRPAARSRPKVAHGSAEQQAVYLPKANQAANGPAR